MSSRPLCLAIAFFVPAVVSPALPFSACGFFPRGCLSGPRILFLPGTVPVMAAVNEALCSEGGRVSGSDGGGGVVKGGGIVDVEA